MRILTKTPKQGKFMADLQLYILILGGCMNTCLFTGEIPDSVKKVIEGLLEDSNSVDVFVECKFIPPVGICSSQKNQVFVNPWNDKGVQFRICFMGAERHFLFASKRTFPRTEQNRIYLALQSAAELVFAEDRKKKREAEIPVLMQSHHTETKKKPQEKIMPNSSIELPATGAVVAQGHTPLQGQINELSEKSAGTSDISEPCKKTPKESLPYICKKILTAIETSRMSSNSIPKQFLSDVIKELFSPASPETLKGLVGPTFTLLRGRGVITPYYDQSKKPIGKKGYRLPAGYSVDVSALKTHASGKNEIAPNMVTVRPKKKGDVHDAPAILKKDGAPRGLRSQEDLDWTANELWCVEQLIAQHEQALNLLKEKKGVLGAMQDSYRQIIDGFQKLGA